MFRENEITFDLKGKALTLRTNPTPHQLPDDDLQIRLIMFVKMLKQISNDRIDGTLRAYGLTEANDIYQFDQEQFQKYKTETLKKRVEEKKYVFFELLDQKGELIGIASGEEKNPHNKKANSFRFLNLYIANQYQKNGLGTAFIVQIFNLLAENGLDYVESPISKASQNRGTLDWYQKLHAQFSLECEVSGLENDAQCVMTSNLGRLKQKINQDDKAPSLAPSSPRTDDSLSQQKQ